jgi:pyruvate ferredoxin oxidoreductase beta subunit
VATLKELSRVPEVLAPGHRMCAGCGAPIVVRQVLRAAKAPVVVANATGCLEVSTTIYPYTSWNSPFIHVAFENASASLSGVEAAYQSFKRQGKIKDEIKFVAFGGDGGTYDIGLQSLSGAMERGHDMVYVCYDNGAYMNTGIQRSSATPRGADTTTTPVGSEMPGKPHTRKNLTNIMMAHGIPYVAQVSPAHWNDLYQKAEKAFAVKGPAFINALAPCPRGWRYDAADTIQMVKLAVDTCFWPLLEVVDGKVKVTYKPRQKKPVVEFLKAQGRFRHLFRPENEGIIEQIQAEVDREWEELLALERMGEEQAAE